jgi:hypothetical protein
MAYHMHETNGHQEWFEVFYANQYDVQEWNEHEDLEGDDAYEQGYYFAFGLPGCLYDSNPFGPYSSEESAYDAAVEWIENY